MFVFNYKYLVHQLLYNLQNAFYFTFYFGATFELLFDRVKQGRFLASLEMTEPLKFGDITSSRLRQPSLLLRLVNQPLLHCGW